METDEKTIESTKEDGAVSMSPSTSLLADQDGLANRLREMTAVANANARLKAKNWDRWQEATADLRVVEEIARLAPELNQSNYDHEDVCRLNAAMCELYEVVRKYRPEANKEVSGER